ncbi:MAG: SCO family protein [Candidatus Acidiferrum sp.]
MKRTVLFVSFTLAVILAGCQSAPEKHYPLQAEVISVDAPKGLIIVKHGEIPGLMPAMTMQYAVADPKQIQNLQPGDKITADLVVSESKGRLEKITLVTKGNGSPSGGASQQIPEKGEVVPDFALRNQNGKAIHLHDFKGRVLLVTFIYTRCPLPDFCPRMNENFRAIQTLLLATPQSQAHTDFLSISFDPQHDTPAILKHYASIYYKPAKSVHPFDWQFAVPAAKDLPAIANFFGLVTQPETAQIVHSLSTTLIGPDGKVQAWYDGNDCKPADVAQAILSVLPHT